MRSSAPIFWVTRPLEDCASAVARIEALGGTAIASPVMHIEPITTETLGACDHLIITSKYACEGLHDVARSTPVWVVGEKTAASLRALGFTQIRVFAKAQYALQAFAREVKPPSDVVYLRGETVRMDITAILRAQHYRIREHICYRTVAETALTPALLQALKHPEQIYVMLYATQAARFARELLHHHQRDEHIAAMHACCISDAVAHVATRLGFGNPHISQTPDGAGMLMLAGAQIAAKLRGS